MISKFKSLLLCLLLAFIFSLLSPGASSADPVTETIYQTDYFVILDKQVCTLSFIPGPFGGGFTGAAALNFLNETYLYEFTEIQPGLIRIYGLCDFFYSGDELVWIAEGFFVLRAAAPETIQME